MRTAILGMAAGYGAEKVRAFLTSISENSPGAVVVLFVDRVRPDVERFVTALRCDVKLIPFSAAQCWSYQFFSGHHRAAMFCSAAIAMLPAGSWTRRMLSPFVLHPA